MAHMHGPLKQPEQSLRGTPPEGPGVAGPVQVGSAASAGTSSDAAADSAPADRRRARADRRLSQRLPVSVAVRQEVVATQAHPAELHLAQSSDLGLGGMRVWRSCSIDEPMLPRHTPLRLAFQLPDDGNVLEVAGEVVFDRSLPSSSVRATGVRFAPLPDDVRVRLQTFLKDA